MDDGIRYNRLHHTTSPRMHLCICWCCSSNSSVDEISVVSSLGLSLDQLTRMFLRYFFLFWPRKATFLSSSAKCNDASSSSLASTAWGKLFVYSFFGQREIHTGTVLKCTCLLLIQTVSYSCLQPGAKRVLNACTPQLTASVKGRFVCQLKCLAVSIIFRIWNPGRTDGHPFGGSAFSLVGWNAIVSYFICVTSVS